ncbi:MAG: hypothetical protein U0269_30735 [Polyangiales bacterium]
MNSILRWGLGFTFAAPAAAPLIAQSVGQANVSNPAGAPTWTLVVLPLLAMLGNALGGVALEFMKGAIALWRAKVRARIRALGENPDNPVINAAPEPTGPIAIPRETKPPSSE